MAELLIAAGPGEWRAAWVEGGEAVELYVERGDTKPPGSLHLGRVVRVVPSLDAALVDIGDERPGFLPLRDVPHGAKAEEGAAIIVEVRREAWHDKAPRLSVKVAARQPLVQIPPPAQLFPPPGLAAALALRLPATPDRVVTDDAATLAALRATFPDTDISRLDAAAWPIDLDAAFEAALSPTILFGESGRIHLAETEAATLIDVDTGALAAGSAARVALAANKTAARLIARALRLRNIGGPVIVDFVGLDRRDHRDQVRRSLEAALADDPLKPRVLGWTGLGHIELVRPRRGRSVADAMLEPGGRAWRPVALAHQALRRLQHEARANPAAYWRLIATRDVATALRGPAAAALKALEARLGRSIAIEVAPDPPAAFDIRPA